MKLLIVLALVAAAAARPEESPYDKYDNVDVDELIGNERLMKNYANCWLTGVKCTNEAQNLAEDIPDAVQTSCGKCSDKHKHMIGKVMAALREKLPSDFEALLNKYDSEGKKRDEIKEFIDQYKN